MRQSEEVGTPHGEDTVSAGGHGQCQGHMVSAERNMVSARRRGEGSPRSPDSAEEGSGCWGRFDLPQTCCSQVPSAPRGSRAPGAPGQDQLLTSYSLMAGVGGCCPAAEAALSNCGPPRWTGTPAMRSWAPQLPQAPQGGRLGGELASNARLPGLERGSGWSGAAGARDEGPGMSEPPAHASASSSVSRPAVPRWPVGLGKETSVTEAPDHGLVPVTSSFPWFHPSLNASPGVEADPALPAQVTPTAHLQGQL